MLVSLTLRSLCFTSALCWLLRRWRCTVWEMSASSVGLQLYCKRGCKSCDRAHIVHYFYYMSTCCECHWGFVSRQKVLSQLCVQHAKHDAIKSRFIVTRISSCFTDTCVHSIPACTGQKIKKKHELLLVITDSMDAQTPPSTDYEQLS